jgi:hypothetical protein
MVYFALHHKELQMRRSPFKLIEVHAASLSQYTIEINDHQTTERLDPTAIRAKLADPGTSFAVINSTLAKLIELGKSNPDWQTVLIVVLLPGLRKAARCLRSHFNDDEFAIETELISGALESAAVVDVSRGHIAAQIIWPARRHAERILLYAEKSEHAHLKVSQSMAPQEPYGHPDLVLARAIREKVLTNDEANLICETRLEDCSLVAYARAIHEPIERLKKRRKRAESRLTAWLTQTS